MNDARALGRVQLHLRRAVARPRSLILRALPCDPAQQHRQQHREGLPQALVQPRRAHLFLDNGVRVMVPPHIVTGTRIVVDVYEREYVKRAD